MIVLIFIFASFVLVRGQMPEHHTEDIGSYENFTCPPYAALRPCQCTTVPDIPTIHCGSIRSLKTVHIALRLWFGDDPIPYLKIVDARFTGLPSRAFHSVNVTRLQIKDSTLKWIARDAFTGMHSLIMLTLHNVDILTFPPESFSHLSSLVSLRLPENKLSELVHNDLRQAGKLKYLSLEANKLTHVERGTFPIILITLSLAKNCLRTLNNSLRNLVNLEWLFLNDNRLLKLEGQLDGLRNLRKLNLARNSIRRLDRSLRDLQNLQELYLEYNSIHRLGSSLHNLSQVRNLNLSMNRLVYLNAIDFEGLDSLESLDLSGNRITFISGAFHTLNSLRRLDLSRNHLRNLSFSDISSLVNLTVLDVSDNRLHVLSSEHTSATLPTERLFFTRNKLSSFGNRYSFLRHFPVLEAVDIGFNKFRTLRKEDFTISSRIDYLGVAGNPLICDVEQVYVHHDLENMHIEVDGLPNCDIDAPIL